MAFKNGEDQGEKGNVVNLSEMRKAQQTLRKKAESAKKPKQKNYGEEPIRWFHYIQLFLFLAVVAFLAQKCNS